VSKVRRAFYLQASFGALLIATLVLAARSDHARELVALAQRRVLDLGPWTAVLYPLLLAACSILLLPGGILSVGSGFFFGLWWGFALVFIGNAIGTAACFGLTRWLGERWLRRRFGQNKTLAALQPVVQREGWKIILLTQLHPVFPTSLLNYLYGLTKTPFSTYMLWALLGRIPGLFLYVYLGTLGQFGLNMARGRTHPRMVEYWIWGGAFVVTILIVVLLSRIAVETLRHAQAVPQTDEMRSTGPLWGERTSTIYHTKT
jgi:uncharacterized membrane protein YdjX (TVP38/TMEM64 family)